MNSSMAAKIGILRDEARLKWRWASSEAGSSGGEVKDIAIAEPPPIPQKRKRVFEV